MSRVKVFQQFFFFMLDPGVESNSTEIHPGKKMRLSQKKTIKQFSFLTL